MPQLVAAVLRSRRGRVSTRLFFSNGGKAKYDPTTPSSSQSSGLGRACTTPIQPANAKAKADTAARQFEAAAQGDKETDFVRGARLDEGDVAARRQALLLQCFTHGAERCLADGAQRLGSRSGALWLCLGSA